MPRSDHASTQRCAGVSCETQLSSATAPFAEQSRTWAKQKSRVTTVLTAISSSSILPPLSSPRHRVSHLRLTPAASKRSIHHGTHLLPVGSMRAEGDYHIPPSPPIQCTATRQHSMRQLLLTSGGVAALALVLFSNTLSAEFVWDDRAAILRNTDLLPTSPWTSLLQHDFWGQNITLA